MKGLVLFVMLILGACASQPEEIGVAYVPTSKYMNFDCEDLKREDKRVSRRVVELRKMLKDRADRDEWTMGIGLLFWPVLIMGESGNSVGAIEYSRLQGQSKAIGRALTRKDCVKFKHRLPTENER